MECMYFENRRRLNCDQPAVFQFVSGPCPCCGRFDFPQPMCRTHTSEAIATAETFCRLCGHVYTHSDIRGDTETYIKLPGVT